jgi:hypothetical protein
LALLAMNGHNRKMSASGGHHPLPVGEELRPENDIDKSRGFTSGNEVPGQDSFSGRWLTPPNLK